jgi:hypothetical protein
MSEVIVAEPVETGLTVPAQMDGLRAMVKEQDQPVLNVVEALNNLDWKEMKPPHLALLLMQKPFPVSGGGSMYLNFRQAIFFATRCYELGVSPFSSEVWFDPSRFAVNLTLEGKRQVARNKGIDIGPPKFEALSRDWKDVARMTEAGEEAKKAGFTKDIGYKCSLRVGDPKNLETCDYTAWISEWYVSRSPVWKQKPEHMLQIRSQEKCISLAMGTGASSMPSERELE